MRLTSALCLLFSALVFTGCGSYDAQLMPGQNVAAVKHFFVLTNPNDTHGINHQIVAALRARDRVVETGPATMIPDETQVVVTYEDHWSWDFGDHLVYLQVSVQDRRTRTPMANGRFSTRVASRKPVPTIVGEVVGQMLGERK